MPQLLSYALHDQRGRMRCTMPLLPGPLSLGDADFDPEALDWVAIVFADAKGLHKVLVSGALWGKLAPRLDRLICDCLSMTLVECQLALTDCEHHLNEAMPCWSHHVHRAAAD